MPDPQNVLSEDVSTFLGGQDASKSPDKIEESKFHKAVNITVDDGNLRPRWAFHHRELRFPPGGITRQSLAVTSYGNIFAAGVYQASFPITIGVEDFIVTIISGIPFLINISTYEVTVLETEDGSRLGEYSRRINWSPGSRYSVIFDYPSYPMILEGMSLRRADPTKYEVPVSILGAYNQNRLFISNAGNEFTAGDNTGNLAAPNAPITFTEVLAPSAAFFDQIIQLPTNYVTDPITAMAFLQSTDDSTGIGPLLVSTPNAVYTYQTQLPRTEWERTVFGRNFLFNVGIAGQRAFVNVNKDLFFIDTEGGVRSVAMSRDEQGRWTSTPISREVMNWIKTYDNSLYKYSVAGYFQNKIFFTAYPFRTKALTTDLKPVYDIAFGGLLVLELDNVSTLAQQSPPVWAGLWTGVRPTDIITVGKRCFVMSKDAAYNNRLYEMVPSSTVDIVAGNERLIRSRFYSREFEFKTPDNPKWLRGFRSHPTNLSGPVSIKVFYKAEHADDYKFWGEFNRKVPWETCEVPTDEQVMGFAQQTFNNFNLGEPPAVGCSPVENLDYRFFNTVMIKLEIQGRHWEIPRLKLRAEYYPINENENSTCSATPTVETYLACDSDWSIPEESICR